MTRFAHELIEARRTAPERLKGPDFDAWLCPLLIEALEPVQKDVLLWLLAAGKEGMITTDLSQATHIDSGQRVGSAVSDLRKLTLVQTHRTTDPRYGPQACHVAVAWVRAAWALAEQLMKEQIDEIPPIFGRRSWERV